MCYNAKNEYRTSTRLMNSIHGSSITIKRGLISSNILSSVSSEYALTITVSSGVSKPKYASKSFVFNDARLLRAATSSASRRLRSP